jgi:hypothetical protein
MNAHPREKKHKPCGLTLAAVAGIASGAARAAIGWLLEHIMTSQ